MEITITKQLICQHLIESCGIEQTIAKQIVLLFFDTIKEQLISGNSVKLLGLGVFYLVDRKQRPGRNFYSNKETLIEPRRVVRFKHSGKITSAIHNQGN